ncbi:unnamed protein product [Symbiodinium sp. CCMP2592]|nr:unnamed protein product [Symbiodinium sp. CCMP2592]
MGKKRDAEQPPAAKEEPQEATEGEDGDGEGVTPVSWQVVPAEASQESAAAKKRKLVLICFFCGVSSSQAKVAFIDVKFYQKPMPEYYLEVHQAAYHAKAGFVSDPTFYIEFDESLKVLKVKAANGQLRPYFNPLAHVFTGASFGYRISQTYLCLTVEEYGKLLKHQPEHIQRSPVSLPFKSPNDLSKYVLIDMAELKHSQIAGYRTVEIYSDHNTNMEQSSLTPESQLHRNQGKHLFSHLVGSVWQSRPKEVRPTAVRPSTLQGLRVLHSQQEEADEAARKAKAAKASSSSQPAQPIKIEIDSEKNPADMAAIQVMAIGIDLNAAGDGLKKPPTSRARRKTSGATLAAALQDFAPDANKAEVKNEPSKAVKLEAGQSEKAGDQQSSTGKATARQRYLASLDDDMRVVAEKHYAVNPHTMTKSLEGLVPSAYIDLNADTKGLNNIINGVESSVCDSLRMSAKRILDNLKKAKDAQVACELLDERITLCDALAQLLGWVSGAISLRLVMLQRCVRISSSMWEQFPWVLQIRICARYAGESFADSCVQMCAAKAAQSSKSKTDETDPMNGIKATMRHLTWDDPLDGGELEYKFSGTDPLLQHVVAGLLQELDQAELDNATRVLGEDDDEPSDQLVEIVKSIQDRAVTVNKLHVTLKQVEAVDASRSASDMFAVDCSVMQTQFGCMLGPDLRRVHVCAVSDGKLAAMAMCFLILLGENKPELFADGNPTRHVFQFTEYKGKDIFRRSIRTVLQKEVWAAEIVALTVTAGSAELLRPKMERLSSVLKDTLTWDDASLSAISPELIQEVADHFYELKAGIREVQFRVLKQQVAALCCNVAKAFVKGDGSTGASKTVDTVWKLLADLSDLPSVLSVLEDFKKWATAVKSTSNLQGLLEYWTSASADNLDFGKAMEMLPETVPILDSASRATFQDAGSHFLLCALQHIVDQANRALQGVKLDADQVRLAQKGALATAKLVFGPSGSGDGSSFDASMLKFMQTTLHLLQVYSNFASGIGKLGQWTTDDRTARYQQQLKSLKGLLEKLSTLYDTASKIHEDQLKPSADDVACDFGDDLLRLISWLGESGSSKLKYAGNEVYNMHMLEKITELAKDLRDKGAAIKELCKGFEKSGANFWRKGLDSSKVNELVEPCKVLMQAVDGKKLRTACCVFAEALSTCKSEHELYGRGAGLTSECSEKFQALIAEADKLAEDSAKPGRLLVVESFMMTAILKMTLINETPEQNRTEGDREAQKSMKQVLLQEQAFVWQNTLGITEGDIHKHMLESAKKLVG